MLLCMIISLVYEKCYRRSTWEYLSVLCGIYMVKGGLLIGAKGGPAFYTCLLVQLFYFAELARNNFKQDGEEKGFFLFMFFVVWVIQNGFYRTGHREDFTAI